MLYREVILHLGKGLLEANRAVFVSPSKNTILLMLGQITHGLQHLLGAGWSILNVRWTKTPSQQLISSA